MKQDVLQTLYDSGMVAIIRRVPKSKIRGVVEALQDGGVKAVEITLNSEQALSAIETVRNEFDNNILVGAGTVLDSEGAFAAISAGARFIISPTIHQAVVETTKRYGAISIPGAYTPTEILQAYQWGADIVKVFPATALGSSYIKDIHGPLPQIPLMPTGGISLTNLGEYLQAGAYTLGIGSSLVNPTGLTDFTNLTKKARSFVQEIQKFRS